LRQTIDRVVFKVGFLYGESRVQWRWIEKKAEGSLCDCRAQREEPKSVVPQEQGAKGRRNIVFLMNPKVEKRGVQEVIKASLIRKRRYDVEKATRCS
jgi:hypothetical protein